MAHAATVACMADTSHEHSGGSAGLALSRISIASPMVLQDANAVGASQSQPGSAADPGKHRASTVLCEVDVILGGVSISSAASSAPHVSCSIAAAQAGVRVVEGYLHSSIKGVGQALDSAVFRASLRSVSQLRSSATLGHSFARTVLSPEQASDPSAYRCHPALADSALHLGAVKASSPTDRQHRAGSPEQPPTRVPVALQGYWVSQPSVGPVPWTQSDNESSRWAVSEVPELQRNGSSVNDVWLLERSAERGGLQAKGLVSKVIGAAKARSLPG